MTPVFTRAEYDEFEATLVRVYDVLDREVRVAAEATIPVFEVMAERLRQALPDIAPNDRQKAVNYLSNLERFRADSYHYRINNALDSIAAQRSHTTYAVGRLDDFGLVEGAKPKKGSKESYGTAADRRLFGLRRPVEFLRNLNFFHQSLHDSNQEGVRP